MSYLNSSQAIEFFQIIQDKKECGSCGYFIPFEPPTFAMCPVKMQEPDFQYVGYCKRYPPNLIDPNPQNDHEYSRFTHPIVTYTDECGERKPRAITIPMLMAKQS